MGTVNFVNIPADLKESCRFCVWKKEKGKGRSARLTKVPYNPVTGQKAQSNNGETFSDFATAMKSFAMGGYDGIGIRVSSGIGAIDIDHCIREDGTLNDVAASVLGVFKDAYFERSPSGSGLRGFFHVDADFIFDKTIYYINNRTHGLEVYLPGATNRFVTVTGDQYRAGSVPADMGALQNVLDTFMKRKSQVVNTHIETVVLLSQQKPDDTIEIDLDLDELDATSAELKATYQEIKDYVLKEFGLKVSNLYISQIKRKCGIEVGENYNLPKSENSKVPQCPKEKEDAIRAALKYFAMI